MPRVDLPDDRVPDEVGVPPPAPADDAFASLEARVRLKLARGEPLTREERAFFARMPADHELDATTVRRGGEP